ncbi:MAG: S8 family serine peptidase, partial [Sedimentisphaerales bacterium]|nr:S8 family serine peptidase [Sedimentisphaerales bacterium]
FFSGLLWSYKVTQVIRKTLLLCLVAGLAVLFGSADIAAGADDSENNNILQPQGLEYTGVYALRQLDPNLTGEGVKLAVISRSYTYIDDEPQNDYRPDISHNCFKTSQFGFKDQQKLLPGVSPHSTAICSILFGEDPGAFHPEIGHFFYEGVTPQAKADIFEFWHFIRNNVFTQIPPDADIITASFGSPFEHPWTRGIELLVESYGIVVVASIGNGDDAHSPVFYPGAGANIIGVGVVDSVNTEDLATNLAHFALAYPEHSSTGPTDNGRCKPDIVAPGNCLVAVLNDPNSYEPTGNGSSFSTPVVAGTIGLLVQKAKENPELSPAVSPNGGNNVIKAILMNSATKLPYWHKGKLQTYDDYVSPLDYAQGAGMLNAVGAYEQLVAGSYKPGNVPTTGWDLNLLDKIQMPLNTYEIRIDEPNDKFITATVVWNRHYNTEYPFEPAPEKDCDLRLELWATEPDNPNKDDLLVYSDSKIDNVEHIHIAAEAGYTNYKIIVSFSNIENPKEPALNQRYGIAWNVQSRQETDDIFWYDMNADGIVNEADFLIMLNNSTKSPDSYLIGDIKSNGVIDANDLGAILDNQNRQADWLTKQEDKAK